MRKNLLWISLVALLILSVLSTLSVNTIKVSALDYPSMYVEPASVSLPPGSNFTVSIKTDYNGSDIQSYQFTLSYNASVLNGVNVTNGDLVSGVPPYNNGTWMSTPFMPGSFNNTTGELSLTGAFFMFISEPAPMTSGPGTLANVTFTVVANGSTSITIGPDSKLIGYSNGGYGDPYDIINAQIMPTHIGHGYFEYPLAGGDVAVTDVVQWFKDPPIRVMDEAYSTWPINLNVTVENVGGVTVSCNVSVYYDSIQIATQNVTDLVDTEIRTLTLVGDITGLDPGKNPGVYYTLKANATIIDLSDINLANNEFAYGTVKVRRWGDVDNSDTITILDLKKVKLAYSNLINEPFADLDGNCVVNILDLKLMKLIYSGLLP